MSRTSGAHAAAAVETRGLPPDASTLVAKAASIGSAATEAHGDLPSVGAASDRPSLAIGISAVASHAPVTARTVRPLLSAATLALTRDLRLAFRKRGQLVQPLVFFAIVTTLFPLAISPELSRLRDVAPGVLWVAALLSSQLALEFLFRDDAQDGTLEQYALSGQS